MENKENKFKPSTWCKLTGIYILDPDGWDRTYPNFEKDWNKKITYKDFLNKASFSTVSTLRGFPLDKKETDILEYLCRFGKNLKTIEGQYLRGYINNVEVCLTRYFNKELKAKEVFFYITDTFTSEWIFLENIDELLGAIKIIESRKNNE